MSIISRARRSSTRIVGRAAQWWRDRRGNATILFGFALLPTIGIVGIGVDYYTGLSYKARLDSAADAAAIAAITTASSYYNNNIASEAEPGLTNDAKAAGVAQGLKVFAVNGAGYVGAVSASPSISVSRATQTFTATVNYTGKMNTGFGKLFGTPQFGVAGATSSSLTLGKYLDFYLLLDVSGSMGIPTSNDGQSLLAQYNPDNRNTYPNGCVFACHFQGSQGYSVARQYGIKLRVDSVGSAVQSLIATAQQTQTLKNQYRIGVFPFIVHAIQAAPLSSDFTQAINVAASLADTYLDVGQGNSAIGSGGTHLENIISDVSNYAKPYGDGMTPQAPKPFVFIVTDGADNNQVQSGSYPNFSWTGSQPQEPNALITACKQAQGANATVAVLYIPYVPIQNPVASFAGNEDGKVNAIIPNLPTDLKSCATPGFFFTANSDADITSAMQAMFAQALQAARLTY